MRHILPKKDRKLLREEIEKTLRTTPEQRLRHLSSLQMLYRLGMKERREYRCDLRALEKTLDALDARGTRGSAS